MGIFKNLGEKFFSHKFPMVGVDISDASIEVMQLRAGLQQPKIKASYRVELPDGLIENGRIVDLDKTAEILKKAFSAGGFANNFCLLSLPDKETFFVNLKPEQDVSDIEAAVYSLAEENLPVELSKCLSDYQLGTDNEVFFVAAPKEIILQYLELFKKAELNLAVIDFESACLARTLLDQSRLRQPAFIIDLGAKSTDILLLDKNGFEDQTNLACGGFFLSQKLAETLNKDIKEAELIMISRGLQDLKADAGKIIGEIFGPVVSEIKNMAADYEAKIAQKPVQIILAGGISQLQEINDFFKKNLPDFIIESGDLKESVDFKDFELKGGEILYANVVGLALRGLSASSLNKGINLIKNLT
ncbi:MAG: pilus assembly protein PilM [Candidatus Parcubacteria bacterium]|nr:pilus assembly protein PilM [Candidatus Parcubacteria bacterium]